MPVYLNGKKSKELWFQGRKIKEAWLNGQKVFSGVRIPRQAKIRGVRTGLISAAWDITGIVGDKSIFSQISPDMIELAVPVRIESGTRTSWMYRGETVYYDVGDIVPAGASVTPPIATFTFVEVI